ncbi:hypothetical protein ABPG72_017946 [Tetrahymena utriculariae]
MKYQNLNQEQQQNLLRRSSQLEQSSSSFSQFSCFESKNQTNRIYEKAIGGQEFSEIDSNFSESFQMQIEGFELSDLVDKFDNIQKNNIIKNIIKSFFGYLLDTKSNDLLTDFVLKGY